MKKNPEINAPNEGMGDTIESESKDIEIEIKKKRPIIRSPDVLRAYRDMVRRSRAILLLLSFTRPSYDNELDNRVEKNPSQFLYFVS